jgi:hypothetical protein
MTTIPIRPLLTLKLATLAGLGLVLLLLSSCDFVGGVKGNGRITSESRTIGEFSNIEADGAFEVKWTPGAPALTIRTDENLMEYMRTETSGGKLRIEWAKPLRGTRGITVNIASSSLRAVQLNGAVRFVASNIAGGDLFLDGNGATRVALNGTANSLSASLNGASRLDADTLTTRTADLVINGAGRADVNVAETLRVAIAGAGRVDYTGAVQNVQKEVRGAGSVRRRD